MKRVTISLDEEIYDCLVDYARQISREDLAQLSISKTISTLLENELTNLKYYPMAQKKKEELQLRNLIRERANQKINDHNDPFNLMQQEIVSRRDTLIIPKLQ